MADASRSPHQTGPHPPDWGDTFAALPLEAPPASAWPAIAARLDQKKARGRNRTWLALAASLFALTALPAAWMLRDAGRSAGPMTASSTTASPMAASPAATSTDANAPTPTTIVPPTAIDPVITATGDGRATRTLSIAASTKRPAQMRRSAERPHRRIGKALSTANIAQSITPPPDDADTALETLYTASAQLETLLTYARDTRVESGPAAALAGAFDAELATIDAQLAQPGLATAEQRALWQARVDTLQRSAGFESTLRLLAADGGRLDGALVSID